MVCSCDLGFVKLGIRFWCVRKGAGVFPQLSGVKPACLWVGPPKLPRQVSSLRLVEP